MRGGACRFLRLGGARRNEQAERSEKRRAGPSLDDLVRPVDGGKQLLALELCAGESFAAWKGCLDDLVARGLQAPVLAIIDGNAGLRRAVGLVWPKAAVQRCCVHKRPILSARRAGGHP